MKPLRVWAVAVLPFVVIAMYIGEKMSSDAAAMAVGLVIGLMAVGAIAAWTAVARSIRAEWRVNEGIERRRSIAADPPPPAIIEACWRSVDTPAPAAPAPASPAPSLPAHDNAVIYLPAPKG